jgi:uncharacterized metal-binding protein
LIRATLGAGFLWTWLWYPYARAIPHRSPWSHWPILGTVMRLAYLSIPIIAVMALCHARIDWAVFWDWLPAILAAVAGLGVSDFGHFVLD